jgi:hypothetical protein
LERSCAPFTVSVWPTATLASSVANSSCSPPLRDRSACPTRKGRRPSSTLSPCRPKILSSRHFDLCVSTLF